MKKLSIFILLSSFIGFQAFAVQEFNGSYVGSGSLVSPDQAEPEICEKVQLNISQSEQLLNLAATTICGNGDSRRITNHEIELKIDRHFLVVGQDRVGAISPTTIHIQTIDREGKNGFTLNLSRVENHLRVEALKIKEDNVHEFSAILVKE